MGRLVNTGGDRLVSAIIKDMYFLKRKSLITHKDTYYVIPYNIYLYVITYIYICYIPITYTYMLTYIFMKK